MTVRFVPEVHPALIETLLSEARSARESEWQQARLIAERGLRIRSDAVLQVLAHAATGGGTWEVAVARAVDEQGPAPAVESHPWWAALGRVTTMHARTLDDLVIAVGFFDQAYALDPHRPFGRPDYLAYVQSLWDTGESARIPNVPRRADTLEEGEETFIDLNLVRKSQGMDVWLAKLNCAFMAPDGLAPIVVDSQARTKFDGLGSDRLATVNAPALITVVMSSYRRGEELVTAVKSILAQTWSNLEIIVVDDCSGSDYDDILNRVAKLDDRIRVLRQETNQGTYMARNRALEVAQGEFVTFQDDDDWSHPQRLERQVAPMLADPTVHSTLSYAIQSDDDLVFRHASRRTRLMNSSSLMFRRRDLRQLGGFDTVRKAGDTEFIRRLRTAVPGRQILIPDTLAFVRLTGGSLSRTDFKPGWNHPTRSEYAEAADWWHRSIRVGSSARISEGNQSRTFPAPQRFLSVDAVENAEYDVVVAADFSTPLIVAGMGWELLSAAIHSGERVGVLPLDDPYRLEASGRTRITDEVRRLLNAGVISRVFPEEDSACGLLVVDDPAILEVSDQTPWGIKAGAVHVLCGSEPVEINRQSYWSHRDATQFLANVLPGVDISWVATNDVARHGLRGSGLDVADPILSQSVTLSKLGQATAARGAGIPVVGRIGSRAATGWLASPEALLEVYPEDCSLDVRILGDVIPMADVPEEEQPRWLRYGLPDVSLDNFLKQLDVYVHASQASPTAMEQRVMTRAVGLGRPIVLVGAGSSPVDIAAVRCEPGSVVSVVTGLCQSPSRYIAAVESARRSLQQAGLLAVSE